MGNSLTTTTAVSDEEAAKQALDHARLQAVANLVFAQEEIGRRILEPTLNTKTLLDLAEHSYKVSGMAAKQKEQESQGPAFSITINIPQVGGAPSQVIDITPTTTSATPSITIPTLADEATALLGALPQHLVADTVGNLSTFAD